MSDHNNENEPVDLERRKAFARYAAAIAGGATVALSAQEVLAKASYRGVERSDGKAFGGSDHPGLGHKEGGFLSPGHK